MKSQNRSDHLPPDPPDDWVNGSWTVDCVCGVNFDDGEEMVNCDECGVWVHTRCSRYVKSEKLFACDKCKSKKKNNSKYDYVDNEEEETEVAQLLIELPTKTLKTSMANPNPNPNPNPNQFRRRLWTEIPMEERVHVQGVPGGEGELFGGSGFLSVFGPQLWKCTGYVPKKFNIQYKEFSCWDEGNGNPPGNGIHATDAGGGAKQGLPTEFPSLDQGGFRDLGNVSLDGGTRRLVEESHNAKKKWDGGNFDLGSITQNGVKRKDKTSLHATVFHHGKRKKADPQTFSDQTGKKKARLVYIDGENPKRKNVHASKSGDLFEFGNACLFCCTFVLLLQLLLVADCSLLTLDLSFCLD